MSGRRVLVVLPVLAVFVILAVVALPASLRAAGHFLIHSDPIQKADVMVVLGGDWKGERVVAACELMKQGVANVALVSGPTELYGRNEADLAIEYARSKGCPDGLLQAAYLKAFSTEDEAREFRKLLMQRNVHSVLLVTSNYHTGRARRVFLRYWKGSGMDLRSYAVPDALFDPDHWWESREGQKTTFYEWSKTLAAVFGL